MNTILQCHSYYTTLFAMYGNIYLKIQGDFFCFIIVRLVSINLPSKKQSFPFRADWVILLPYCVYDVRTCIQRVLCYKLITLLLYTRTAVGTFGWPHTRPTREVVYIAGQDVKITWLIQAAKYKRPCEAITTSQSVDWQRTNQKSENVPLSIGKFH